MKYNAFTLSWSWRQSHQETMFLWWESNPHLRHFKVSDLIINLTRFPHTTNLPIAHHHQHHFIIINALTVRHHRWLCNQFPLFSPCSPPPSNSRRVHSLMLSSHLFCWLPCFRSPFTVPCRARWIGNITIPLQFVLQLSWDVCVLRKPAGSWHWLPCC